jgi:uncharacterized protein (TIGR03118 family)
MNTPAKNMAVTTAWLVGLPLSTLIIAIGMSTRAIGMSSHGYMQHNLVSDDNTKIPAANQDTTLLNPWGVAFFPGGPFWINDNGSGISALYQGDGTGFNGADPALPVTIPPPAGGTSPSAPTGIVANTSFVFNLNNSMPAAFIFATEDGTISAWNLGDGIPGTAELKADNSAKGCSNGATGAVYKGLAVGTNTTEVFVYATNFRCGTVDVFDGTFKSATLSGNFQDSKIPNGFAPFGIANVRGNLVVTYAKQDDAKHDDVAGAGNGFVDIFDTNGNLIQRFASQGKLNSPWGIADAPFNFGRFSKDLLVGNFGDGRINAFVTANGHSRGQLADPSNKAIAIDGLWSLFFGGGVNSDPGTLYFTAGPNKESDGLFGSLTAQ